MNNIPYEENMTDAMLAVVKNFEKEMEKECLYCQAKLKAANQASDISLPATTERGTQVVRGARVVTNKVANYWWQRLQNATMFVSREFEEEHNLWNNRIGMRRERLD
ncbi:hypothetical protein LC76P1_00110 [Lysinibacillus phage LC76P1]|nr:hypothetical protein LC76P1_00110 [Lysinibacillus phage LC76P1]